MNLPFELSLHNYLCGQLLDLPDIPDDFRPEFVTLVRRLSEKSRLYPECLVLKDVKKYGDRPKAGGTFGDVWKGVIQDVVVAIKVPRIFTESNMDKILKEFSAETTIWRQLVHPNILPFYGVFYSDELCSQICLVSAWMEAGNITEYLGTHPGAARMPLVGQILTLMYVLLMSPLEALDVARGLDYLHTAKPKVIHGDLKGASMIKYRLDATLQHPTGKYHDFFVRQGLSRGLRISINKGLKYSSFYVCIEG